jgi:hypothetical protein
MTSGAESGTAGGRQRQVFWMFYAGFSATVLVNNLVNAVSENTDMTRASIRFLPWEPLCWEMTSAASTIALIPAVAWLVKVAPPARGRWLRFAAVHVLGTIGYCLGHVLIFHGLRRLVYLALGHHYGGSLDLAYEYPKDLRAYLMMLLTFWLGGRLAIVWAQADEGRRPVAAPSFDIREGARTVRAPVTDILGASSAGNYVEFHLADGRRPLMRTTLASAETALKPYGFVRTHRSWLINPLRVRGLVAEGSGDYRIELDGGVEAPLSRRFPKSLEALRTPAVRA